MYSNKLPKDNKLTLGLFVCHIANLLHTVTFIKKTKCLAKLNKSYIEDTLVSL